MVLALSLGQSAVYAALRLWERAVETPIADQVARVQTSRARSEGFDFLFQLLDSLFALVPVALVLYLFILHTGGNPFRRWGLDFRRPGRDWALAAGLFVLIGAGTLVIYFLGRSLGVTAQIVPAEVTQYWWSSPMLLLAAVRHSLLEEVIMIAYLFDRARRIWPGVSIWLIILGSAVLRGAYHLYQGFGPGIGNLAMGVIFGWLYTRYGRVMPLVIAHFLLDAVAFLAFPLVLRTFGLESL
ncbi:CPBP family intramembrane glutamic endopeptidase [Nesterenkonia flava]|uniref:CPBP family intramembrane glutamic endopeptidase n=1 Tax=Nesterenkonia flava TaxID=469799 RepID=A0ABU1FT91_9MICC|nr:CPBP family intramembrane glutamic endopeptidase [Nesterenkonia flava]MDR5711870.1 CPBP family intramembrane glutamic endopeptidase [Nesterenkonia flava]